jgi:SAM-dependent methyltransferase
VTGTVLRHLAASRTALEKDLRDSWKRKYLSPVVLGLYTELLPRLDRHARGTFLDAGCGTMPFRRHVEGRLERYDSLDVESRAPGVTYIADVRAMPMVPTDGYDTVLCSEVLEHVSDPERALTELHRVLRPGGTLVLSVPFLSRLHEEPHDYFRYTRHGLEHLLRAAGFRVAEIVPTGSVFSFLGHQLSTILVTTTYRIPLFGQLAFAANALALVVPCYWLDRVSGLRQKLPAGYVAVAFKE